MAFCPSCKYEYRPDISMCPDCSVPLVEKTPNSGSAAISPDDSWVVVGKIASKLMSEMAKGSLDSQNIPSVVLSSTFGAFGNNMEFGSPLISDSGGNVIMVPREYHEDAAIILESILGDDLIFPDIRT